MKLQTTCSGGGPIIAIPAEFAANWRGTLAPLGVKVPDGWEWGVSDAITCDYDRACYEMQDFADNGDSGFGWLTPAGTDGMALILDMELVTAFLSNADGGVIIRNSPEENLSSETAQAWLKKIPVSGWKNYTKTLNLKDGRIFIFDSAYQGCAKPSDITAFDGVVVATLTPGNYTIKYYSDSNSMEAIALVKM